jgi:DNA-binding transcriptional regulator YhcF (GntR family)
LAHRLGVTTGTVSRAYAILERQGLATAHIGFPTYPGASRGPSARVMRMCRTQIPARPCRGLPTAPTVAAGQAT